MATLAWLTVDKPGVPDIARPHLDLSGPLLASAFEALARGSEQLGGVERYVEALKLKSALFKDTLGEGKVASLNLEGFMGLCTFMATVRRRVAPYLSQDGLVRIRAGLVELLEGAGNTATTDQRMAAFCARFPTDKAHRFVHDLAAEVLHNVDPERYPLMNRWVWDAKPNTGAVREIWFGDNVDHITIPLPDGYPTFLMLREELAQFLTGQGVFRDVMFFVDMLTAQIYANYISAQGGTYLRADFSTAEDPMHHTRRILGLDGIRPGSSRMRLKAIDGEAFVLDDSKLLG
ncbi:MAG: hypothetical protein KGQ37_00495 [Hyphomicrobiales bacterium]|nr:hypothetical protein [Hyphomicrobiales bacterium]